MQKIEYPKGSKVTIEDGIILIEPAKWEPKVGEIVKINAYALIVFYTNARGADVTTGINKHGKLYINSVDVRDSFTFSPVSEDDKTRLLTALSYAGYQYNEETHEVEKVKWKPKESEDYFSFTPVGIYQSTNIGTPDNIDIINNGFAFQTEAKAQEFFDKIKQLANENR